MNNDNLDIRLQVDGYDIRILKFAYNRLKGNVPAHSHSADSYEIHYIPEGYGTLVSQGRTYEMGPGILCTTGPHVEHAQFPDPRDPMAEYCIYLKIEQGPGRQGRSESRLKPFLEAPFWFGTDREELQPLLGQILEELTRPGQASSLMLEGLFLQFLVRMLRNYDRSRAEAVEALPVPLLKTYILIEDSFLNEYRTITLEQLSRRLGLSTRQTARILYARYGRNFLQKRTEARMAAAAAFLREDRLTAAEIADRLGYSCPNHFHAAFKKYFHSTVGDYRRQHRSQS